MDTKEFSSGIKLDWEITLITWLPNTLETSSILHVAVLVFLRAMVVLKPMRFTEMHLKVRYTSIALIWITTLTVRSVNVIALYFNATSFYYYYEFADIHCFHTIPAIFIIFMYGIMTWIILQKSRNKKENTVPSKTNPAAEINKRVTLIVRRIVLFYISCYVPYLAWKNYYLIVICNRKPFVIHEYEVSCTFKVHSTTRSSIV